MQLVLQQVLELAVEELLELAAEEVLELPVEEEPDERELEQGHSTYQQVELPQTQSQVVR